MKYTIKYIGQSGHEYKYTADFETRDAARTEATEMGKSGMKILSVRKVRGC
jgi:hypothetical protein